MGVVWLKTSSGFFIHLPIVGGNFNHPSDAVPIPTSVLVLKNRCLSGQASISVQGKGTFTLNFDPPGRTGSCNQCGSCCTHPVSACDGHCGMMLDTKYNVHKCEHLDINPGNNKLGTPGQTQCRIRESLADMAKGCMYTPEKQDEIWAWMTNCGFTFG